ncbi:bifunctional riboflavin kinase/FAD synthetase [Prevotella jejuni]|uniref:bifunctional riboflavin kinase/FAD synthetase n=1 Tax=Prevotella jejuni TaxID=1177574 RepID=UPI0028EDDD7D|nr:bifunctional riboflavin kinase/FAD synthetase [Prevotella jejuni]
MNIIYINKGEAREMPELVATIGFFDGVHRGHRFLIDRVIEEAQRSGMSSAVITFDRHPREVLQTDYQPDLLSTLNEKLLLLSKTHVDNTVVLHFDASLAALTAHDFMRDVLQGQLKVRKLIIGYDNRFGHNRSEGFDDYVRYGKELGIEVIRADAFLPDDVRVSSSFIRTCLREGRVEDANRLLGYDYTIESRIVSGYQNGRKMGFPTANLDVTRCQQLLPASGVYAVLVRLKDSVGWKRGMMNIGHRPTFNGRTTSMEVNLFNFSGDLYGQELLVSFISKIRDERKFDSIDALAEQLQHDKVQINKLFDTTYHIDDNLINIQ